ncbi:hypothetical protein OFM21_32175, partial [Escherichia coli]|nr:hypothetical protein [Escherichia coli]
SLTLTLLNSGDGTGTGLDPAGVALPGLGGRGGQAGAESAAQFGLSLPTSVLPPALQALDALDLRAPAPQDNPGAGSGLTPPGG